MQRTHRLARPLAWFVLAGQLAFIVSWVVAGSLEPGYSHIDHYVSDLGARGARHPWIVNAGLITMGLSIAALAPALLGTLPRPRLLWRRFPLRFRCRRESTFLSDDVWYYDDQVLFGDGRVEARRRFCQLVAPDRIHVTADDMPDGAEVALGERGFRIGPFWLTVPLGPLRWPLRCREQSRFERDGTFVETFHLRSLGLPAGRMTFRVRPEGWV
jgi:hypothetical protein